MDYTQLTPQQLIELKHEQQNFLWEAKHGDNRIYTPEKIRQAQNDIKECNERLTTEQVSEQVEEDIGE